MHVFTCMFFFLFKKLLTCQGCSLQRTLDMSRLYDLFKKRIRIFFTFLGFKKALTKKYTYIYIFRQSILKNIQTQEHAHIYRRFKSSHTRVYSNLALGVAKNPEEERQALDVSRFFSFTFIDPVLDMSRVRTMKLSSLPPHAQPKPHTRTPTIDTSSVRVCAIYFLRAYALTRKPKTFTPVGGKKK